MRSWELNGLNILIILRGRFSIHILGVLRIFFQIFGLILLVPRSEYKFLSLIVRHSFRQSLPKKVISIMIFFAEIPFLSSLRCFPPSLSFPRSKYPLSLLFTIHSLVIVDERILLLIKQQLVVDILLIQKFLLHVGLPW